jgi:hypothetical protein
MNRDWIAFRGKETRALRKLLKKTKPNVYLNMHGWIDQTLGTTKLNRIVDKALGLGIRKNGVYGTSQGYAHGWVHAHLNIPATLVEYKSPRKVSTRRDITMIRAVIRGYSH